ncbi:hypothetical protein ACFLSJ_04255 [Verrucomicrobiota bacterium]
MTRMTSRERLIAALKREEVDFVPCCASFNPLDEVFRRDRKWNFPWTPEASRTERIDYQVNELGLDQVVATYVDLCRPHPDVTSRTWIENGILHKSYSTPAGDLHASVRYNEFWPHGEEIHFWSDFNIGHFVEPWIENEQDLECLKYVCRLDDTGEALEETRDRLAESKKLADQYGLATLCHVGSGLTGAQQQMGAEPLCFMTIDRPDLVDAFLEHEHRQNLHTIEILSEMGVDIIRRNGFYETADFYSPEMLERFLGNRLRVEADSASAHGMLTSYTVHTGIAPILDYLGSLHMDSLFGIDIAFKGLDLNAVRARLGETTSFWTGPSSTYHLWKGADATREAVRKAFEVLGNRGLVLAPCVSAHSIMPWESTLAMIDEWKKLRFIPQRCG